MKTPERQPRINNQIRVPKVLLIENGKKIGIVSIDDALQRASDLGLDLVEVASQSQPPVCSILDYGKFKYEQNKKEKANKHHAPKEKQIQLRYVTEKHDLETKLGHARKFLADGKKVAFVVEFKKREMGYRQEGFALLQKCLEMISDCSKIEQEPRFTGRSIFCRVAPKGLEP